jgi:hypothetical protein
LAEYFKKEDQDLKMVELVRVPREDEALTIKSLLGSYGIECILQSDITHSVYPLTVDGLGEVIILVSNRDLEKSKKIISETYD